MLNTWITKTCIKCKIKFCACKKLKFLYLMREFGAFKIHLAGNFHISLVKPLILETLG